MIDTAFIREIELQIGPFKDDEASGTVAAAKIVKSDGSREGLRIDFNITKTIASAPNQSQIVVYNLAPDSRKALMVEALKIILKVGWKNRKLIRLSSGGLLSVDPVKDGNDIKTNMVFFDGYSGLLKGVVQETMGPGTAIATVVEQIAKNMKGVTVNPGRIRVKGTLGSRGRSFSGRAASVLDTLAEEYGFSWSVQDDVFQALADDESFPNKFKISSKAGNLFYAVPILSGPGQRRTGVEITAFLDPTVYPGDIVVLESQVNPELDGEYRVHNIIYTGSTFDSTFEMQITSYRTWTPGLRF